MQLRDLNRRLWWWLKRKKILMGSEALLGAARRRFFLLTKLLFTSRCEKIEVWIFPTSLPFSRMVRTAPNPLSMTFRSPNFLLLLSPCSHIVWLWILHFPLRHRSSSEKFTLLLRFLVFSSPSTITRRFSPNEDGFSSAFMAALKTRLNRLLIRSC